MSEAVFTIYGLRRCGDREIRYVGQTKRSALKRMMQHIKASEKPGSNGQLGAWIRDVWPNIEPVTICRHATREEANECEQSMIHICQRLDQRLLNVCFMEIQ